MFSLRNHLSSSGTGTQSDASAPSSTGFRTTRLRAPSLVPNSRVAQHAATAAVQQTLVVDAARQTGAGGAGGAGGDKDETKHVRRRETIFGPDVGEDDEPGWTKPDEGTKVSVDVVKGWVEKAKNEEGLHVTTTLQALVNLKRPTLLLQQLEPDAENDITTAHSRPGSTIPSAPLHLLKFNYDATTPDVHISISVHPSPTPAVEGKESIQEEEVRTVYSGVHAGGFNQVFQLPASSALDLSPAITPMPNESTVSFGADAKDMRDTSIDTNASSVTQSMNNMQLGHGSMIPELPTVPEGAQDPTVANAQGPNEGDRPRRRFGIFPRRQRPEDVESAAAIEMTAAGDAAANAAGEQDGELKEPEKGMRLLIRIEALGPTGDALKRQNAQLTHILVNGMWVPDAGSSVAAGQGTGKRVWVVKVVRREAIIGSHTFLLKEIYGLSSASTGQGDTTTSYPPTGEDPYASTPNECIVCLTSPRDVVLLPCRHLVVCRDCAVGMVEFGAGGKVARREETTATATTGDGDAAVPAGGVTNATVPGSATATGSSIPNPAPSGGTTTTGRERRKRKPKGWYCPVCRQPYTSLLRLALPATGKPLDEEVNVELELQRAPSRAASVRTTRTTATLPRGAEEMLDSLRPNRADQDDEDEDEAYEREHHVHTPVAESERPQFILGNDDDHTDKKDNKTEVEHREAAASFDHASASEEGRAAGQAKGWKEAS